MVHCADTTDAGNLRETSEHSNCVVLVKRGYFSRPSVHITTTKTGRGLGPDQRRSKEPSFVYQPAPDPQPRWELNHIRMAPEMGPGEAGDKPLPPYVYRIPAQLEYLRMFTQDSAYLSFQEQSESHIAYKCRLYDTLCTLMSASAEPPVMRIMRLWPTTDWATIWKTVHEAPVSETVKVTWYRVIHDIIPTRTKLPYIKSDWPHGSLWPL